MNFKGTIALAAILLSIAPSFAAEERDPADIARVIESHKAEVATIYNTYLDAGLALEGTVVVNLSYVRRENALEACLVDTAKPTHQIAFGVRHDPTHIIFDVNDNGIGMDEETQKNMFTLFFSSKGDRGTGLGLFISNKIIRQHGGTIEVTSRPGKGTRMGIKIPKTIPDALKKPVNDAATRVEAENAFKF